MYPKDYIQVWAKKEKRIFIKTCLSKQFGISKSREALDLKPLTYYYKPKLKDETWLVNLTGEIIELLPGAGHRTIAIKLKEKGFIENKKRVIRIMKENNLVSKKANKFRLFTTDSNHSFKKQ